VAGAALFLASPDAGYVTGTERPDHAERHRGRTRIRRRSLRFARRWRKPADQGTRSRAAPARQRRRQSVRPGAARHRLGKVGLSEAARHAPPSLEPGVRSLRRHRSPSFTCVEVAPGLVELEVAVTPLSISRDEAAPVSWAPRSP
jgi:hypothetical protein